MGHPVVGLHSMVFGGMVRIMCVFLCVSRLSWVLWLHKIIVMVDGSSLAAILAQWMVFVLDGLCQHSYIRRNVLTWMSQGLGRGCVVSGIG